MTRGLSLIQHRCSIVLHGFLVLIVTAGLSGCMSTPTSSKPVVCTPKAPNVNIYKTVPQTWTNTIFQYAATPAVTPIVPSSAAITAPPNAIIPILPSEQQILRARYAAFHYLINESKRWSDTETINLDDSSEAQITVTFLSPELLQAVFLSEVLKYGLLYSDFETQTQTMLNSIAARDELLFLLTITTTNNGSTDLTPHIIDIPINQMTLTNGEDLQIAPKHDDHVLDQPINSSSKPVSGYLAYPLAVLTNNQCNWVLEPKYNTSIVVTVSLIQLDGVSSGPYTWTIPYSSLVHADIPPNPPNFVMPPEFDQNQMSPLANPPNPAMNLTTSNGMDQNMYWQNFARFIWNQITLGNY
jgi:hypothetical protein